jgi:PHD/YefM family antitoxin component YafN of YafNO toxin-antitoxin module
MVKSLTTVQSSELNRNSVKVFAAAEVAPVIVTRRDGESFVLMTERESLARQQLFELAAQLIAVTTDDARTLVERMTDHFPWMYALSEAERVKCADDLIRAARASFATGEAHLVIVELSAWRETASAIAEGLTPFVGESYGTPRLVKRPTEV